jgi:pyrimidine/purine-5'-nucleotide nucleosidase
MREEADEGRDHRPRQAAQAPHALHRYHQARHHRRGVAEPDRQSPGDHAGHRGAVRALVRLGRGIIVLPGGGVGTAEEILDLLGILLREENASLQFPLIFTGPTISAPYLEQIDRFIGLQLVDRHPAGVPAPIRAYTRGYGRAGPASRSQAARTCSRLAPAFSGIVASNVKEDGMRRIEAHGSFEIHGDRGMMQSLDALLRALSSSGG